MAMTSFFGATDFTPSCFAWSQVYVIGEIGIQEELDLKGFQHIGGPEDGEKRIELSKGYKMPHDPEVRLPFCRFSATNTSVSLETGIVVSTFGLCEIFQSGSNAT